MMMRMLVVGAMALAAGIASAETKDFKVGFGRLKAERLGFRVELDELKSARGETAVYGPVKMDGLDFTADMKARPAADEAYDLNVTLANTGAVPRFVRLRFRLEVPIKDYRFWNGFLNQSNGKEDVVEGMETFFPAIAAMDAEKAIVLGFDPSYNASLVKSGCEKIGGRPMLTFVFPVYLEAGHPFAMRMTAAATKARYRWHDVVEKWYELYAEAYAPADAIHPGALSSEASYLFWQPEKHGLDRGEKRAAAIRRIYRELPTWDWCYKPFVRGGDWSITDELSVGWRGHSKRQVDVARENTRKRLAEAAALNVAPMWYLNCCWIEKELFEQKFQGTLMREKPRIGKSWQQKTAKPVYCGGDSGYARLFRAALERIPKEYPDAKGIAWDSCFANSLIRETNDGFAGTYPKAFDEKGVPFAHEAVGIAGLLDFNHAQFSGTNRMANAVNYKLVGPWMIGVRTDSGLYEGTPMQRPERLARIESLRCRLGPNKIVAWHKGAQFSHLFRNKPWSKLKDLPKDQLNDLHRQIRDDDMLLSYYWGAAPCGGLPGENTERCVSAVHELVTLVRSGWHPSPAVDAPEGILVARYGSEANMRLAVINPGYEARTVELNLPAEYWPQFPRGRKLTVEVPARQVMIAGPDFNRPAVPCEALPPAPVNEIRRPTLIDFMKRCHI